MALKRNTIINIISYIIQCHRRTNVINPRSGEDDVNHHAPLLNNTGIEVHLIIEVHHDIEVHQTKEQGEEGVYPMMIITRHHIEIVVRQEVYIAVVIDG